MAQPWLIGKHTLSSILLACALLTGCESANLNSKPAPAVAADESDSAQAPHGEVSKFVPETAEEWVNYYYYHNDASAGPAFVANLLASRVLESNNALQSRYAYAGFFGALFKQHPDYIARWLTSCTQKCKGKGGEMLADALVLAGKPELVKHYTNVDMPIERLKAAPNIDTLPVTHPAVPLLLMYAYGATGDDSLLKRLIDLPADATADTKASSGQALTALVTRHTRARLMVQHEIAARGPEKSASLNDVLQKANQATPPLTGTILLWDMNAFDRYSAAQSRGNNKVSQPSAITSLRAGQKAAVLINVANPSINDKGEAKVTLDIAVRDKDGTLLPAFSEAGITVFDGALPVAKRTYPLPTVLTLAFGTQDPAGEYTLQATLRDGVSGKKTVLTQPVILRADGVPLR